MGRNSSMRLQVKGVPAQSRCIPPETVREMALLKAVLIVSPGDPEALFSLATRLRHYWLGHRRSYSSANAIWRPKPAPA